MKVSTVSRSSFGPVAQAPEADAPNEPSHSPLPHGQARPRPPAAGHRLQTMPVEILDAIAARLAPADVLRLSQAAHDSRLAGALQHRAAATLATYRAGRTVDLAGIRESLADLSLLPARLQAEALAEIGHGVIACDAKEHAQAAAAFMNAVESLPPRLPERNPLLDFARLASHGDPLAAVRAGEKIPAVAAAWGIEARRLEKLAILAPGHDSIGSQAQRGRDIQVLVNTYGITDARRRAVERIAILSRHPEAPGEMVRRGADWKDVARLRHIRTPEGLRMLAEQAP